MSYRRNVLVGSITLGAGQALNQGMSLARNVIVARMVSTSDYGIASVFMVTVLLLESLSDLGAGTFIVQSKRGDDQRTLDTAHALNSLRGLGNALILFALAWPLSSLFGIRQARWAFQCLALWPLLNGLAHLDPNRMQRQMRFNQWVVVDLSAQALALLAAWPLTHWLHDYSALLWLLLLQKATSTLASFVVAERSYRWTWNRDDAAEMFRFGWPLLINGALMYLIFQGDRLMIGASQRLSSHATYTLADLGVYSVALSFSILPMSVLTGIITKPLLPLFASVQDDRARFVQRYRAAVQGVYLTAGVLTIGLMCVGGAALTIIYGSKYAAATHVFWILAAAQGLRLCRVVPATAAQALADNQIHVLANIARLMGFIGALGAAIMGADLRWFATSALAGEMCAIVAATLAMRLRHGVPINLSAEPLAIVLLAIGGVAAVNLSMNVDNTILFGMTAAIVLEGLFVTLYFAFAPELRVEAATLRKRLHQPSLVHAGI